MFLIRKQGEAGSRIVRPAGKIIAIVSAILIFAGLLLLLTSTRTSDDSGLADALLGMLALGAGMIVGFIALPLLGASALKKQSQASSSSVKPKFYFYAFAFLLIFIIIILKLTLGI